MFSQFLTDYECEIVDRFIIKHEVKHFDYNLFNLAVSNTLPTWRVEQLLGTENTETEVYQDYVKRLIITTNNNK